MSENEKTRRREDGKTGKRESAYAKAFAVARKLRRDKTARRVGVASRPGKKVEIVRLGSLKTAWARLARGCRETIFARKWGYRDANDPKDGKDVKPLIYANPNSAVGESTDTRRMGTIGQSNEPTHPPPPSLWRASVGCYIGLGCRSLSHPPSRRSFGETSRLAVVFYGSEKPSSLGSYGDMRRSQTAATQEWGIPGRKAHASRIIPRNPG
jgi:hypothetical protein